MAYISSIEQLGIDRGIAVYKPIGIEIGKLYAIITLSLTYQGKSTSEIAAQLEAVEALIDQILDASKPMLMKRAKEINPYAS